VGRLVRKELREILRDRRTIITLVLMPLLLYPLLSLGFQQFFLSAVRSLEQPRYLVAFVSAADARATIALVQPHGLAFVEQDRPPSRRSATEPERPEFVAHIREDVERGVADADVDLGVVLSPPTIPATGDQPTPPTESVAFGLIVASQSALGRQAAGALERALLLARQDTLFREVQRLAPNRKTLPFEASRREVNASAGGPGGGGRVSLNSVLPFILILMTVTGAVYPAIDLTAGERERGTLEVLVSAPIPRLQVLFSKYVAVLCVALLTALANLSAMYVTLWAGGMIPLLFGDKGLPASTIVMVLGLLGLFASFFSALLLVLTSFARSFKEAQAYLVPLMLASLAPGVVSLTPELELKGVWLVTPLVNVVMLARDLLEGRATLGAGLVVVAATAVYAMSAIAVAARIFGSESVLYGTSMGWKHALRRPAHAGLLPTPTAGLLTLAIMFPGLFLANAVISRQSAWPLEWRLAGGAVATILVFGALPLGLSAWNRYPLARVFAWRRPSAVALLAALMWAGSLWMFAHELVLLAHANGVGTLDPERMEQTSKLLDHLRAIPLPLVVLCLAVVPALCEELFFRGLFHCALRQALSPFATVGLTALVFAGFHLVATDALTLERFPPSLLMGLALGVLRERSGSLIPGVILHTLHNGGLVTLGWLQPWLISQGWGLTETAHIPVTWLAAGAAGAGLGLLAALKAVPAK
jgi:ABC-2 type transport system permease protein/sodium transport system permease protein